MRSEGWQERLAAWALARAGNAFEWGESDCAMLCAEAVDILYGGRRMADGGWATRYRGKWASARAAIRYQHKHGDLAAGLARAGVFRWQGAPLPGDLILHPHPQLAMMSGHVCLGVLQISPPARGGVAPTGDGVVGEPSFESIVISSNPEQGVFLGRTADALAQPGSFVMRIA